MSIKLLIQNFYGKDLFSFKEENSILIQKDFFPKIEEGSVTQIQRELTSELKDDGQWLQL